MDVITKGVNTVDEKEIEKFHQMADEWWNPNGKFKPLHIMNPYRVFYIKNQICAHFNGNGDDKTPLKGLKILDIGCGGGLISEAFARLGAHVTGIDADEKTVNIARAHLGKSSPDLEVEYCLR